MFGKNLKYYRLKNNLTMKELADKVGVTSMAISNYERELRRPDMQILKRLAESLNINVSEFLSVQNEKIHFSHNEFRKNSKLGKARQEYITEGVEEYFQRFFGIVNILGDHVLPIAPKCCISHLSEDDDENAKALRIWLGISLDGPVGNLVDMLENKGIFVYFIEVEETNFSGINGTVDNRPYIVVNQNMNPERKRFTIAHELAHMYFEWPLDMTDKACEKRSDAIAGAFLLPNVDAFRELGIKRSRIHNDVTLIAKEYGISMLCLAYRARELKIIGEDAYRNFSIRASEAGWRKNEPSRIENEESMLFKQLVFRGVVEGEINYQKGAELLKISYDDVRAACMDAV